MCQYVAWVTERGSCVSMQQKKFQAFAVSPGMQGVIEPGFPSSGTQSIAFLVSESSKTLLFSHHYEQLRGPHEEGRLK